MVLSSHDLLAQTLMEIVQGWLVSEVGRQGCVKCGMRRTHRLHKRLGFEGRSPQRFLSTHEKQMV
jgi:hypothetical protein